MYIFSLMIHAYYPKTSIYSITKLAIEQIIFGLLKCNFGFGSLVIWLCAWIKDFYRIWLASTAHIIIIIIRVSWAKKTNFYVVKQKQTTSTEWMCGFHHPHIEKNHIKISWTKIRPDFFGDVYLSVESVLIVRTAWHSTEYTII